MAARLQTILNARYVQLLAAGYQYDVRADDQPKDSRELADVPVARVPKMLPADEMRRRVQILEVRTSPYPLITTSLNEPPASRRSVIDPACSLCFSRARALFFPSARARSAPFGCPGIFLGPPASEPIFLPVREPADFLRSSGICYFS